MMHNTIPIQKKGEFGGEFDYKIGKHIMSIVQTSDGMFETGIVNLFLQWRNFPS